MLRMQKLKRGFISTGAYLVKRLSRQLIPNVGTLVAVALMLFAYHAWAAPGPALQPQAAPSASTGLLSYQGYLTDAGGEPLHGEVDVTFRLYSVPTEGTALWTEAHTGENAVPVTDGLFNVMLGSLTPIPDDVWSSGARYLGIQIGDDVEMTPRETIGSVPSAMSATTIPDGSVTLAKLDATSWTDLPLEAGFESPPNPDWQKAQYRRIGDMVYLRGLIVRAGHEMFDDDTVVAVLPEGFHPPKNLAFAAEPHHGLTTKHRLDVHPNGEIEVQEAANASPYVSLDGILFSISP